MSTVIDASALLAVLKRERGWEVVDAIETEPTIAAVNLGEAAQRELKEGRSRQQFEAAVAALGLTVLPVDAELALDAAEFREMGRKRGLSQADCICLALARRMSAVAMTADRAWAEIAEAVGVAVRVIR